MTTNIYILKLEQNKYYIGKTNNIDKRILQHKNNSRFSAAWTKKYKYISTDNIILNASPFDEDRYTLEYMDKYGIDNIRGGRYVKIILDKDDIYNIQQSIWSATDCCIRCGNQDHFIQDCDVNNITVDTAILEDIKDKLYCNRCGRTSHNEIDCYANLNKKYNKVSNEYIIDNNQDLDNNIINNEQELDNNIINNEQELDTNNIDNKNKYILIVKEILYDVKDTFCEIGNAAIKCICRCYSNNCLYTIN